MSEFAEYLPMRPDGRARVSTTIAEAAAEDLMPIATLTAEREGGAPEQYVESIASQLGAHPHDVQLFVSRLGSEVVAFGRVSRFEGSSIPAGWYLSGIVVSRPHRRRGIGNALTEHRIRWLMPRSDTIYYFANSRNRATIDLHAAFGFREVQRDITVSHCTFHAGMGVLYRLRLKTERNDRPHESTRPSLP